MDIVDITESAIVFDEAERLSVPRVIERGTKRGRDRSPYIKHQMGGIYPQLHHIPGNNNRHVYPIP